MKKELFRFLDYLGIGILQPFPISHLRPSATDILSEYFGQAHKK